MSLLGIIFGRADPIAAPPSASNPAPPEAAARGTPVNSPATRHAFGTEERGPLESRRTWRMADVVAAIVEQPRAASDRNAASVLAAARDKVGSDPRLAWAMQSAQSKLDARPGKERLVRIGEDGIVWVG